jgi:hypothetical protein
MCYSTLVSRYEVMTGHPATGVVTLGAGAFLRTWSGHILLVVRPGDTALRPAPVSSSPPAAMTPDSSFATVQLHTYVERLQAGERDAGDAFLRRVCGRLERPWAAACPNPERGPHREDRDE